MKIRLLIITCFVAATGVCFAQNEVIQDSVQTAVKKMAYAEKPVIPPGRIVLADMKAHKPEMYSQYQSKKKLQRTGIIMTSIGGGFVMMGAIFSVLPDAENGKVTIWPYIFDTDGDNRGLRKAGPVIMVAGAVCLSVGLPTMIVNGKRKKQTLQDFKNQHYLPQQPSSSYIKRNISEQGRDGLCILSSRFTETNERLKESQSVTIKFSLRITVRVLKMCFIFLRSIMYWSCWPFNLIS